MHPVVGLVGVKAVAVVLVELSEDSIDGFSELLIGVSHFDFQLIIDISLRTIGFNVSILPD